MSPSRPVLRLRWLPMVLLLASLSARAAEKPSLAFMGVYDADDDTSADAGQIEATLSTLLGGHPELTVVGPDALDGELGQSNRMLMLASLTPAHEVIDQTKSIPAPHVLLTAIRTDAGTRTIHLTLLRTRDGLSEWSESVPVGQDLGPVVNRLASRLVQITSQSMTSDQAAAQAAITATAHEALALTAHIEHSPVTRAWLNSPIVIRATVDCPRQCVADLYYRRASQPTWFTMTMVPGDDAKHLVAALPPMSQGPVEYYISVATPDLTQLGTDGTEAAPHVVQLVANESRRRTRHSRRKHPLAPHPKDWFVTAGAGFGSAAIAGLGVLPRGELRLGYRFDVRLLRGRLILVAGLAYQQGSSPNELSFIGRELESTIGIGVDWTVGRIRPRLVLRGGALFVRQDGFPGGAVWGPRPLGSIEGGLSVRLMGPLYVDVSIAPGLTDVQHQNAFSAQAIIVGCAGVGVAF